MVNGPLLVAVAPSVNVLGAYFPDWMFCILGAFLVTFLVHHLLRAIGVAQRAWLGVYPALAVLLALSFWLVFFQN